MLRAADPDASFPEPPMVKPSLQMSEDDWSHLIADVEAARGPAVAPTMDRRDLDMVRHAYTRQFALRVTHGEAPATLHVVRARNLSAGGLGFFHGCFLYTGTPCHVALQTVHGEKVALPAKVSWCRHVRGQTHEIGVRFDRLIEIKEFICLRQLAGLEKVKLS